MYRRTSHWSDDNNSPRKSVRKMEDWELDDEIEQLKEKRSDLKRERKEMNKISGEDSMPRSEEEQSLSKVINKLRSAQNQRLFRRNAQEIREREREEREINNNFDDDDPYTDYKELKSGLKKEYREKNELLEKEYQERNEILEKEYQEKIEKIKNRRIVEKLSLKEKEEQYTQLIKDCLELKKISIELNRSLSESLETAKKLKRK